MDRLCRLKRCTPRPGPETLGETTRRSGRESMGNENVDRNLIRARFHSRIFLNDIEREIEQIGIRESREILLSSLREQTVTLPADYFEVLYNLFQKTEWKHLTAADKVFFFRNWFVVISDEYAKAFTAFKETYPDFNGAAYHLETVLHDRAHVEKSFGVSADNIIEKLKAECNSVFWNALSEDNQLLYLLVFHVLGVHLDETGRWKDLHRSFDKDLLGKDAYSIETARAWKPSILPSSEEVSRLESQVGVIPIFVNLKYLVRDIEAEVRKIIKPAQEQYFAACPERKTMFIKEDSGGRADTYPFDEWRRYLEVYLLRRKGTILKDIPDKLKGNIYVNARALESQVSRDERYAKNLSYNALSGNFPGKYK